MELGEIRKEIDEIDGALSALFQRRMALAGQVAAYKQAHGLPVLDDSRERAVLDRAAASAGEDSMKPALRRLFEHIMAESRQRQQNAVVAGKTRQTDRGIGIKVAFLGQAGSFSHEALGQYFGAEAQAVPQATFEDVVEQVAGGRCGYGMLPVENSLTGGIFAAADLLTAGRVKIVGETVLAVRHCLLGLPGATAEGIKTVLSHPQPLEQCRQFICRQGYQPQACGSTTDACVQATGKQDPTVAAIASEAAGRIHGLVPLMRDIQDNPANYTRFAIISASDEAIEQANKISAVFVVEHQPGTLYGTLRAFADRGINILNLVSRPITGSPWQYCFHMDFGGNLTDRNVQEALTAAGDSCRSIIILGNYRKWEG